MQNYVVGKEGGWDSEKAPTLLIRPSGDIDVFSQ